jgi:hypothetical protein
MKDIIDGFLKFQRHAFPERKELFRKVATSQNPSTLFISCSDSRMVPELVTQRGFVRKGEDLPAGDATMHFLRKRVCRMNSTG